MMKMCWFLACFLVVVLAVSTRAQEPAEAEPTQPVLAPDALPATPLPSQEERFQHLEDMLSGVKLVGHFTVLGRQQDEFPREEYTIHSIGKLDHGDFWLIRTRIKYGDHDVSLPLPIEVKWAADTPVITLTNFTIPGMGTFNSRVVLYDGKYADTWSHGEVRGHLFGTIEKLDDDYGESD